LLAALAIKTGNFMRKWILEKSAAMTEEGIAYWVGAILFALALVAIKPSRYFDVELPQVLAYVAVGFLIYGFWTYLSPVLKKASESLIVRALWAAITIAGATVSFAFAQLIVNETLKVPSSAFPHTQTLVAVLVAPVVIGILVLALGLVLIPVFQVMLHSETGELSIKSLLSPRFEGQNKKGTEAKYFVRFVAFFLILVLCGTGLARNDVYLSGVGDFARWFAFHFETENYSSCVVDPGARVGYLGGDRVVVASKDGNVYDFKVAECAT
jgi:xanthine/uracil permease